MLKKTITFEDYSEPPQEVTQDFYFNFTKVELLEKDLEFGGIKETIDRLTKTENAKEAYELFKVFILAAYGERSADGRGFHKEDQDGRPLSRNLEASPALSEIIMEFLEKPEVGAQFMEACLPAKLVAEVKAMRPAEPTTSEINEMVAEAARRQEDPATRIEPAVAPPVVASSPMAFENYTHEELLNMPQEKFQSLVPSNPKDMTQDQLLIAFQRKNQQ